MFELKIILTIIITLGLVLVYLGSNPVVSGLFASASDIFSSFAERFPFSGDKGRDIEFVLISERYDSINFSASNPLNITVVGDTAAALPKGNISADMVVFYGFRGSGMVSVNSLVLDGKINRVELPGITFTIQDKIKSSSNFTSLKIVNLALDELRIAETSGVLTVRNTSAQFSGNITVIMPSGNFSFHGSEALFEVRGRASRIQLGSGISID